jgi:EAL domain-containing protein (putative c-di-GMP-specific phosphodiesterase class I)
MSRCIEPKQNVARRRFGFDFYPGQLKDRDLKAQVIRILQENGIAPQRLEIEINESVLVQDLEAAQQVLGGLRDAGVRIALDNLGTGYSSLSLGRPG